MAAKKENQTPRAVKAQVAHPVPGKAQRFTVLEGNDTGGVIGAKSATKRQLYDIYYGMYRQHPIVRAAVDKRAKVAVKNGYALAAIEPEGTADESHVAEIKAFFRRSRIIQLLRLTFKDIDVYGEAFWWIELTRGGRPYRARRLHPKHIDIFMRGSAITKFTYGPLGKDDKAIEYKPKFIVHFKEDDLDNDVHGLSKLASLITTVATDLFAMEYNGSFFENSAQTGVVFNMSEATEEEVTRNRLWLEQNYVGTKNAHRPLILEGNIKVERSVSTVRDMEYIQGRHMNRRDILAVFGINEDKLGFLADTNRSTGQESDNSFREEEIAAAQSIVEEAITDDLILDKFGFDDIAFTLNDSSMRDQLAEMKYFIDAARMGIFTIDFVRNLMGLPKVEGGDKPFVQTSTGLVPLALLEEYAVAQLRNGGNPQTNVAQDPFTGLPEEG